MNFLLRPAQVGQVSRQHDLDTRDISPGKVVVFPKLYRSRWTFQIEHRLSASSDYMDMSRPVVVWIDRYAQSVKTENCRHYSDSITIPKRLGFTSSALPMSSTFATSFVER